MIQALKLSPCTMRDLYTVLDRGALSNVLEEKKLRRVSRLLLKMKAERAIYAVGRRSHAVWHLTDGDQT